MNSTTEKRPFTLIRLSVFVEPVVLLLGSLILGGIFWSFHNTDPMWGIISFILVYDPEDRIILSTAFKRILFTMFGSVLALGTIFAFGMHKWTLPASLVLLAFIFSVFLHSRPTRRIIRSSLTNPSLATYIAVTRSMEVSVGSLLAILFSWCVPRITSHFSQKPQ